MMRSETIHKEYELAHGRSRLFSCFVLCAQATSAKLELFWLTIYYKSNRLDIRHPAAIGVPFRVAHIMTKRR